MPHLFCKTCYCYSKAVTERKGIKQLGIFKAVEIHIYLKIGYSIKNKYQDKNKM